MTHAAIGNADPRAAQAIPGLVLDAAIVVALAVHDRNAERGPAFRAREHRVFATSLADTVGPLAVLGGIGRLRHQRTVVVAFGRRRGRAGNAHVVDLAARDEEI